MSTHLCTFSRATPGTDPAPTPATGPQPLSAITICVKYEPSSSVGYTSCYALKYCRKTVLISWKILAKNIFKLVFDRSPARNLFWCCVVLCVCKDLRCGAKMLCAVCGESAAAGWKRICGPRQDAAKLHWKLQAPSADSHRPVSWVEVLPSLSVSTIS